MKKEDDRLINDAVVRLREKSSNSSPQRPNSIADRLSELNTSQESWKVRVEESDARKFTVAAKIAGGE